MPTPSCSNTHERLTEMEINPLLARAEGRGVAAADALAALQ
jgi:hypothetical protein